MITSEAPLWDGQDVLIYDHEYDEHAVVSGVGYGKTHFAARWHFVRCVLNGQAGCKQSFIGAPTHKLLKQNILPMYLEFLDSIGLEQGDDYIYNRSDLAVHFKGLNHTVLTAPLSITTRMLVSFSFSHAWIDECGLTSDHAPIEVAKRTRDGKAIALQTLYTGSPEGTNNWFYKKCGNANKIKSNFSERETIVNVEGEDRKSKLLILHGKTKDNKTLPASYIDSLYREFAWNPNLIKAYINGEFVPVYEFSGYDYDKTRHMKKLEPDINKPLYLTWDFNVSQGAVALISWTAIQEHGQDLHCVRENRGRARGTLDAIDNFIEQFPPGLWGQVPISITGDCNGRNRSTRGDENDYDIISHRLKAAGYRNFTITAPYSNPLVSTRLATVNRMFSDKSIVGNLLLDNSCVKLDESFRTTTIDKFGKIEKPSGDTWTHPADGVGYYVCQARPIRDRLSISDINRAQFAY